MTYSPIKCPNCGSGQIVPAENGRVYCKSCDQFSEKSGQRPKIHTTPAFEQISKSISSDDSTVEWMVYYLILAGVLGLAIWSHTL